MVETFALTVRYRYIFRNTGSRIVPLLEPGRGARPFNRTGNVDNLLHEPVGPHTIV